MPAGDIFITTDGHTYKVLEDNASVTLWYMAGGGAGVVNIPQTVQDSNNVTYTVIHAGDICNNRYITAQTASTLTDIILPPSVTKIGGYAFRSCRTLISVIAPNVTEIYNSAFTSCINLVSVELPALSVAGAGAFTYCYSLTYISFPVITDIEENTFNSCTSLRGLYVGNRAQTDINISGEYVFFNVGPLDISFSFFYSTASSWPESFISGGVTIPCIFYSPAVSLTSSLTPPVIGEPVVLTIDSTDVSLLKQYRFTKDGTPTPLLVSTLNTYTIPSYAPAIDDGTYRAELIDNFSNVYRTNSLLLSIHSDKITPTIFTWPAPVRAYLCGQSLESIELRGGSASVPGIFAFVNPAVKPPTGTSQQTVIFTPADTETYNTVTETVAVISACRSCVDDRGKPNSYGADHESIRVRKRIDACKCCGPAGAYTNAPPTVIERCTECHVVTTSQPNVTQALSEHQRMMRDIIACPVYEKTYTIDIVCLDSSSADCLIDANNPYIRYDYRTYDRISGIEEIADTVRGISSSEITARRRRIQEVAAAQRTVGVTRRHAEHFRSYPPPPPCRVVRTGPQPGVPIAPVTPCNLGNQRVDYSIPQ